MARIRTIKPEFPQSESMGSISRDARLCFVELWTIADDFGRLRGNPKMLASLLFPYDDDAPGLIVGWLEELEDEGCIQQYKHEGQSYLQITNWGAHQKIDKPTPSKIPGIDGTLARIQSEKEIEMLLYERFKTMDTLFGYNVIDAQRQVRVGSSYLDIVVTTDGPRFIFELKKNRLKVADLKQVYGYAQAAGGIPILVGFGLSPLFSTSEAEKLGVAVITISEDNTLSLIIPSNDVKECSITLSSVTERSTALLNVTRSYSLDLDLDLDQGKDQGKEGNAHEQKKVENQVSINQTKDSVDSFLAFAISAWNSAGCKPYFTPTITVNLSKDELDKITKAWHRIKDIPRAAKAVQNYAGILESKEHKAIPDGFAMPGFFLTGVDVYADDADPWERCRIKTKNDPKDLDDDTKAEILKKLKAEEEGTRKEKHIIPKSTEHKRNNDDYGFPDPSGFVFDPEKEMRRIRQNAGRHEDGKY